MSTISPITASTATGSSPRRRSTSNAAAAPAHRPDRAEGRPLRLPGDRVADRGRAPRRGQDADRRGERCRLNREVLRLRMCHDDGAGRLLGVELVFLGEGEAELVGAEQGEELL